MKLNKTTITTTEKVGNKVITTKKEYTEDTDVERSSTNVAVCIVCVCIFIGALALVFLL